MAGAKFAKGSEEWQMFKDYWLLCKKYWEPENNDAYWEEVVKDTDKFYKKYNSDFSRALALALVHELELKIKKRRMGNE